VAEHAAPNSLRGVTERDLLTAYEQLITEAHALLDTSREQLARSRRKTDERGTTTHALGYAVRALLLIAHSGDLRAVRGLVNVARELRLPIGVVMMQELRPEIEQGEYPP